MLLLAALALSDTASAAPRLVIQHGDAVLIEARPPFERLMELVEESRYLEDHPDGFDLMQVRELPADELGDLARGQVWRAWQGPARFVDCTVSRFVVELAGDYGTEGDTALPPEGLRTPAGTYAELRCEAPLGEAWLVVRPEDPVPLPLALAGADTQEARALVDAVVGAELSHPAVEVFRQSAAGEPLSRDRRIDRADTRAGHLLIERGRLYTGAGDTACGGEDLVLSYVIVVREGPSPQLLQEVWFPEAGWARELVDVDQDGLPELLFSPDWGSTEVLLRQGRALDTVHRAWWGYCPC